MYLKLLVVGMAACALAGLPAVVYGNVYASSLEAVGDDGLSYRLNENADTNVKVEVLADGVPVYTENLGPQTAGVHSWSWSGAGFVGGANHTVKVTASDNGYGSWTQISTDQTQHNFWLPVGVSVNTDPCSPNFGKAYVSNSMPGTTGAGRTTPSGIYMLNADGSDAGYATGGVNWDALGNSAPYQSNLGPDGLLYVTDFSNDEAYGFNADLSVATKIIGAANKTSGQYVQSIWVEGSQATGDRKVYAVDSNYYGGASGRKGLIEYNLGGAATASGTGTQYIGPTYWTYYPSDVTRDRDGNWYMNSYRGIGNQESPLIKFEDGAPPINVAAWEASSAYYYSRAIAVQEDLGIAVFGGYNNGFVYIFDINNGNYLGQFDAGSRIMDLNFDAAGNLYTADSSEEWLRVWSPPTGPNSYATETCFTIIPEPATLALLTLGSVVCLRRRRVR